MHEIATFCDKHTIIVNVTKLEPKTVVTWKYNILLKCFLLQNVQV